MVIFIIFIIFIIFSVDDLSRIPSSVLNRLMIIIIQLMRAYTLSLLAQLSPDGKPVGESEIITWANNRSAPNILQSPVQVHVQSRSSQSVRESLRISENNKDLDQGIAL